MKIHWKVYGLWFSRRTLVTENRYGRCLWQPFTTNLVHIHFNRTLDPSRALRLGVAGRSNFEEKTNSYEF